MDAFESIICTILEGQGYWTKQSFKVKLTKEDKEYMEKRSSPRWEIDLLACKPAENKVLVVECKSYLDSRGVLFDSFDNGKYKERYKLFTDEKVRKSVIKRLKSQLVDAGLCTPNPELVLTLATGKIASERDRDNLHKHFQQQGWELYDDKWVQSEVDRLAEEGYSNDPAIIVAKLLKQKNRKH